MYSREDELVGGTGPAPQPRRSATEPGGRTGRTALDKFVMHYTAQGYEYETANNDFIFQKPGSVLFAEAVISPETGHITGYNVRKEARA